MLTEFLIGLGQYPNAGARALGRARAQIGYDAFMAGKRVAIAGIGNRIAASLMHFVPNALLLRLVDQRKRAER
jgi:hypothetical protein